MLTPRARFFVNLFFATILAWPNTLWAAQAVEKVRVAYPSVSMPMAPWWIAQDKGIFRQEGLVNSPSAITAFCASHHQSVPTPA
jgi:ABC-type nitrate/sulfonate/bicarbonate transport system substrate-binding protein